MSMMTFAGSAKPNPNGVPTTPREAALHIWHWNEVRLPEGMSLEDVHKLLPQGFVLEKQDKRIFVRSRSDR